jgi:hypothetical protein
MYVSLRQTKGQPGTKAAVPGLAMAGLGTQCLFLLPLPTFHPSIHCRHHGRENQLFQRPHLADHPCVSPIALVSFLPTDIAQAATMPSWSSAGAAAVLSSPATR